MNIKINNITQEELLRNHYGEQAKQQNNCK